MANDTIVFRTISSNLLLSSVVFKFIAMIIGISGNMTVLTYTFFLSKEKTATSYLIGNLAVSDLLVCLTFYPIWIVEFLQGMQNIENDQDLFCKISRPPMSGFMFASVATLLVITIDRYLYFVKSLKYPLIVTRRRVFLAVTGIWLTACCVFIVNYVHYSSYGRGLKSVCYITDSIVYLPQYIMLLFTPLTLIFFLNYKIFAVVRKQRKRMENFKNFNEQSTNIGLSLVVQFMVALKQAKTFAIVVTVLAFCVLIPTVVGQILLNFCSESCWLIWFLVFNYELYGINSIVNAFIYEMRHLKYRKAYGKIIFKLLSCQKPSN